jgi:hypothetical protein
MERGLGMTHPGMGCLAVGCRGSGPRLGTSAKENLKLVLAKVAFAQPPHESRLETRCLLAEGQPIVCIVPRQHR